ncbi:Uncharacterised protein [Bordetella pertussis]|nr:Uncharacterised protein [Bordetella pertussis]
MVASAPPSSVTPVPARPRLASRAIVEQAIPVQGGAVGRVDGGRAAQRGRARGGEAGGRGQAAAIERHVARAQVGVARDLQRAGIDLGASRVPVVAVQYQGAQALLDQPAGAIDRAAPLQRRPVVGVDRGAPGEGRIAAGGKAGGRMQAAVVQGQRAAAQVGVARDPQRAGLDHGAAGIGVRAAQGQRARALFDQPARAGNVALQIQRGGVGDDDPAAAVAHGGVAPAREPGGGRQRAAVERQHAMRLAQVLIARDAQHPAGNPGTAGVGIVVLQHERAVARLGQRPRPADLALPLQGVAARHRKRAVPGAHDDLAPAGEPGRNRQGAAIQRHRALSRAQVGVARHLQGTGVDRGAAVMVVVLDQHQLALALFVQAAGSADGPLPSQRGAGGRVDGGVASQGGCLRGREAGGRGQRRVLQRQRAGPQVGGARYLQRAGPDLGAAGMLVVTGQHQRACALLDQRAGASDRPAPIQRGGGSRLHRATSGQLQTARGRERTGRRQPAVVQMHGALAQIGVGRHLQRAGLDAGVALVSVGSAQHQGARPLLAQLALAADGAVPCQRGAPVGIDLASLVERGRARGRKAARVGQPPAVERDRAGGLAEVVVARYLHGAALQARAAGVGVGAGQRQRTVAGLGQRAGAVDDTAPRHVLAGRDVDGLGPGGQLQLAIAGEIPVGRQPAAVERDRAIGRAQVLVARDLHDPAPDLDALGVGIVAAQHERAAALLVQLAVAVDRAAPFERSAVKRLYLGRALERDLPRGGMRAHALEHGIVFQHQCSAAQVFVPGHTQLAAPEHGLAGVLVDARECQAPVPFLDQIAGARYRAAPGQGSVASHVQGTADKREIAVARKTAAGKQISALQGYCAPSQVVFVSCPKRAGLDHRATRVRVGAGQDQRALA